MATTNLARRRSILLQHYPGEIFRMGNISVALVFYECFAKGYAIDDTLGTLVDDSNCGKYCSSRKEMETANHERYEEEYDRKRNGLVRLSVVAIHPADPWICCAIFVLGSQRNEVHISSLAHVESGCRCRYIQADPTCLPTRTKEQG